MVEITEHENDLHIKAPIMLCDVELGDGKHPIPSPMPNKAFFMMLIGSAGSGKTSFLVSLLTQKKPRIYRKAFESVFGYAQGGIASGPVSGFSATLHGTEAVVPLPDGKTIPVETKQVGPSYDTKIMADMLQELKNGHQSTIQAMNELVRHTKTTASYSSQLVQLAS